MMADRVLELPTPAPVITVRTLAEILAHPELLVAPDEIIPGLAWKARVGMLAGREKLAGKSTYAAAGCATRTRGGYFLDRFTHCGNVLWLSADNESLYDQVARFQRFGAEPKNLYIVTDWDRTPSGLFRVADGADVVVIDTLASFVELVAPDAGSSSDWTPIMLAIKRCANETGAAFLLLHHANKATGSYRDSTAIGAGVDVILEMTESTEAPNVRHIKARARWSMADFSIRLDGDTFTLDAGLPSLDAQVLALVVANPGISRRKIERQVEGRTEDIVASLKRLSGDRLIEDRGHRNAGAWFAHASTTPPSCSVVPSAPEQPGRAVVPEPPRSGGARNNNHAQPPAPESGTTQDDGWISG